LQLYAIDNQFYTNLQKMFKDFRVTKMQKEVLTDRRPTAILIKSFIKK
jgi:hypothetical protein